MYEVTMPKLSDSMKEGKIIEWKVKEGSRVTEGDVLAEVESDKATMELECFRAGVLQKIVHGNDSEVSVGEVIALIAEEGEAPAPKVEQKPAPEAFPEAVKQPAAKPAPQKAKQVGEGHTVVSPYARKLAQEKGVDPAAVKGTGPGGRVTGRDIEGAQGKKAEAANIDPLAKAVAERREISPGQIKATGTSGRITVDDVNAARAAKAPADEEFPPLDLREGEADVEDASYRHRTQARIVTASKRIIPHFYLTDSVNVTALMAQKEDLKQRFGATLTHVIMLACIRTLQKHPEINRSYDRGKIIKWKGIHLGLAIDTPEGLTVAVARDAQNYSSLAQFVKAAAPLVEKARAGKLSADERRHPTFTISNLGMFNIEQFAPIINPPSAVTLAVASALKAPVVHGNIVEAGYVMKLTLSCDHRIVDGATTARFMNDLKGILEDADWLAEGS